MLQSLILLALGAASVLQGGINKQFIAELGLARVVVLNNLVLLIASVVFLALQPTQVYRDFRVMQPSLLILPGVLGLSLVAGIPWAISKWGASFVFIGLIGSQVAFSLLWDLRFESAPFDFRKIVSLAFAVASLFFMIGGRS